jgi:hypothetical protein
MVMWSRLAVATLTEPTPAPELVKYAQVAAPIPSTPIPSMHMTKNFVRFDLENQRSRFDDRLTGMP